MRLEPRDGFVVALALAGAVSDLRTRRVPNLLTGSGAVLAAIVGGLCDGWTGILRSIGGIAAGLGLLGVPFALRLVGAGDVKFLMALGGFLGLRRTLEAFIWATAIGGLLALTMLGVSQRGRTQVLTSWIQFKNLIYTHDLSVLMPTPRSDTIGVPYGLALALGAVIVQLGRGIRLG